MILLRDSITAPQATVVARTPVALRDWQVANSDAAATFPKIDWIPAEIELYVTPAFPNPSLIGSRKMPATTQPSMKGNLLSKTINIFIYTQLLLFIQSHTFKAWLSLML